MGKQLFIVLLLSYSLQSLACDKKINNAKVDLFVDTNQSELEIEVARKAACARGERLVVIPKNYKDYTKYTKSVQDAQKKLDLCFSTNKIGDYFSETAKQKCGPQMEAKNAAYKARKDFNLQQPQLSDQVKAGMETIKKENAKVVSVAISGHDGGGHFGGDKGDFSRYDMAKIMAEFPEQNEVSSLLLLGCYTGVTNEVKNWRSIFPKVKLIGGYDGSAPLSTRPQGHEYIMDIMMNEKKIIAINKSSAVDSEVKRMLAGIEGLNAAVWVDPLCSEEGKGFYYASKLDRTFRVLDPSACEKAMQELAQIAPEFDKYNSGELEPPTDTGPNGPLRKIYDKVRTHQHCLKAGMGSTQNLYGLNDSAAFNLLFWEGVKKNYAEFYDKDMQEAQKIMDAIKAEDVIKGTEESIADLVRQMEEVKKEIEEYKADPEKFKQKLHVQFLEAEKEKNEFMNSSQYQTLMNRVGRDPRIQLTTEEQKLIAKGNELMSKSATLQYNFGSVSQGYFLNNKEGLLRMHEQTISQRNDVIIKLKNEPDMFKKVFAPTKAALKDKTRKQILENVHNIHKLMNVSGLSHEQRGALSFISSTSDHHLRYFQNPFSWHEYTGHQPETPPYPMKLSDFTKNSGGVFGGFSGGYGYGSGGGYVGGAQGGAQAGAQGGMNGGSLNGGSTQTGQGMGMGF